MIKQVSRALPNLTLNLVSDKVYLDFLLMKIRARTISYATMKKKKTREKEESLLTDIKLFEEKESKIKS